MEPLFDFTGLDKGLTGLKQTHAMDAYGVCVDILFFFRMACPDGALAFFNRLASDCEWVRSICVEGHCAAKVAGHIEPRQTRCILPLPSILRPIDLAIGQEFKRIVDIASSRVVGYEECAKPGKQCMDIAFQQSMVVEKSGDQAAEAACVQADIKRFYCHIVSVKKQLLTSE